MRAEDQGTLKMGIKRKGFFEVLNPTGMLRKRDISGNIQKSRI